MESPGRTDGGALAVEYAGLVRVFFSRRCAAREDAEDLAQEALCAVIAAAPRFRGESRPSTWVYAVCRNVWSGWLSKREAERARTEAYGRELAAGNDRIEGYATQVAGSPSADPALGLDLATVLDTLRPSERELYGLYYVEGRRLREIAALLGKPEGTVKYLLSALRAEIRKRLS